MIKGKKVYLRAVEREDLPKLQAWRNLEGFRKNFREHRELSSWHQEKWLEKVNSTSTDYMFAIVRASDQKLIGACGLLYINWIIRSGDFSFYIGEDEKYIDQDGFAEEATQLLLKYGFEELNLNKVWMELYEFDQAKINFFMNRFKFMKDGLLRQNCFKEGKYHDSWIISLLKSDYSK